MAMALVSLNAIHTPSSSLNSSSSSYYAPPSIVRFRSLKPLPRFPRHIVRMAPEEEKITRRSPLDFPIEWERPKPGRRPDIFPQFSPMKTPLPPPLPADPPEEDEEEEEEKKEEEEEPEQEETEKPEKQ
ncbi:coiled-coil domain-containing protein 9 [Abrus precatorius]|uniref:Coiled-coil domain-containing protein 9 n=1 Tax=Abrus precatorius TaxID=3816 RepID=A0A8B8KQ42_ABRPR|nr:coiled-coil domain-containing protein 9 [Abrus precatorius]